MTTFYGFRCPAGHVHIQDTTVTGWTCPDCGAPVSHDWRIPGGALDAYAWPGGYPIIYLDAGTDVLCAKCAEEDRDSPDTLPLMARDIHWEGPAEICAECNVEIPSAYGESE